MASNAFVVMQIGTAEADHLYDEAIVPVLAEFGLTARRADRHSDGHLLVAEILDRLTTADLVIADLTSERPSCYFEVGYAFGQGKETRVILTAREDHIPGAPGFRPRGPKVHFDLAGYEVLGWHPDRLDEFRAALAARVRRRLSCRSGDGQGEKPSTQRRNRHPTHRSANLRIIGRSPEEQLARDCLSAVAGAVLGVLPALALARLGAQVPVVAYPALALPLAVFAFFVPEHLLPLAAARRHRWLVEQLRYFALTLRTLLQMGASLDEVFELPMRDGSALRLIGDAAGAPGPGWPWRPLHRLGVRIGSVPLQQLAVHAGSARDTAGLLRVLRAEEDALEAWIRHDEGRVKAAMLGPLAVFPLGAVAFVTIPLAAEALQGR
jgi:hypothetical protein